MGCEASRARELVYADGIDLESHGAVVPVGVTCRICERMDCEQRAFPPLQHPLAVNENVRGVSFYAPPSPVPLRALGRTRDVGPKRKDGSKGNP
jgi:predicted transcriptional regulator